MKSRNFPIGDNFKVYKHKYTNFFIESNRECEKKVILPTNQKQRETFRMNRLAIKMQKYHVVLGSASPRRRELLAGLNIPFDIVVKDTMEKVDEHLSPEKISESIAEQKFEAFLPDLQENDFLITADTLVYLDRKTMGKPKSADDARNMIRALSGKTHSVVTAVCIGTVRGRRVFSVRSDVTFAPLNGEDIDYYVETYKPFDKAGAYGVQEWIGYMGIEKIEGSFYNVMGLPVQKLYTELLNYEE